MEQRKIIGENIKTARKLKGLSQRALAEKIGIAFQNLSVWENGKGAPSARYLMKLSEILEISIDQLTSESGVSASISFLQEPGAYRASYTPDGRQNRLPGDIPSTLLADLAESHSMKLIIAYLEEIITLLRHSPQEHRQVRQIADNKIYATPYQERLQVPLPPPGLASDARSHWERNAAALLRWSHSGKSFWVPQWVLERFCREVDETRPVSDPNITSSLLKEYLERSNR
jgi:transcriptional regulator with XRE-family HTH domain